MRTPGSWPRPAASTPRPSTPTSWWCPRDDAADFVAGARDGGVLVSPVGPTAVRLVTHLDISREDAEAAAAVLSKL